VTTYLVGRQEEFDPLLLKLIEAESETEALMSYRRCVFPSDPEFLDSLADKSVNMSFIERFWIFTPEEQKIFVTSGKLITTETQFKNRLYDAFGERQELASQYIQYLLDGRESDVNALPPGLAEFAVANFLADDWSSLFAVPLNDISCLS